jgi:phage gpG-like protein
VAFSGPHARLEKLAREIKNLPDVRARLNQELASRALELVQEGFRNQHDPYGQDWAPLAASTLRGRRHGPKKRSPRILEDTGIGRNSYSARADENGFRVGSIVMYMRFHQLGTRNMPSRKTVPSGPAAGEWSSPLRTTAIRFLTKDRKERLGA